MPNPPSHTMYLCLKYSSWEWPYNLPCDILIYVSFPIKAQVPWQQSNFSFCPLFLYIFKHGPGMEQALRECAVHSWVNEGFGEKSVAQREVT